MKNIIWISILLFSMQLAAQDIPVRGVVYEMDNYNNKTPLYGVSVYWAQTSQGVFTDREGKFTIDRTNDSNTLVFGYVGFKNDSINSGFDKELEVILTSDVRLDEVNIVHEQSSTETSFLNPFRVDKVNEKELQKAACCSLSESFDTNPTIDVSFTDAVTGTKQIQMLGLAGPNIQITRELMPAVRGFNSAHGLELIPGTWIHSIQLNKGTGSVVNGFESITGQINVELRKPEATDKFYLNLYGNQGGRTEANIHLAKRLNKNWSTGVLLHGRNMLNKNDRNSDGFIDMAIDNHVFALNRWKYAGDNGLRFQFGAKYSQLNILGGQTSFDPNSDEGSTNTWGAVNDIKRVEGWAKIGKVFDLDWKSLGVQLSAISHDQDSYFGLKDYSAKQNSLYANGIYQSILSNTFHQFKTGFSLLYDEYLESLDSLQMDRTEIVPGAFFEYTYTINEKFNLVAGLRGDHHNLFGAFATPRLHMRYALQEKSILRAFGGRGQRTANVISENAGILASSRDIIIQGDNSDKPYGLNPEVAWNYGVSYSNCFPLGEREATVIVEGYRTDFENQIVLDLDQSARQAIFYNLDGRSYSTNFSAQFDYELFKNFDIRLAYRWNDVKTNYNGELLEKIFVSKNRAFANVGYETNNDWKFDATINWQDRKRLPSTLDNPIEYQLAEYSDDFYNINAQITKKWKSDLEIYLGMENILDFRQDNPILSSADPFSEYFDSSLVWGPIFGRNTYLGLRYRIR